MDIAELYEVYLKNSSIQTDTRKLVKGDIFFALKGPNFNGNEFAQEAINKGACIVIIDDKKYSIANKTILVKDVLETLQQLAKYHRQQFTIPFIAITGSNGKTTTKELIHSVLSSKYKTYTTEGNLNNHIGVPLTILKIRANAQMAVLEMGANHLNEIASYCKIALPTHGLITNCGKAHLEGFGSEEGVRKAKGELFDHLKEYNGTAFVLWDYDYLQKMSAGIPIVFKYGIQDADIEGNVYKSDPFLQVKFCKGISGIVETNLVGSYNLPNILAAAAVGKFFNISEENIKSALSIYTPSNSRSQLIQKGSNKFILDAYNANPSSMKVAIENFANAPGNNKYLILGAMAELGKNSLDEHKLIIKEIEKHTWRNVLLVGGDFLKISHPYLSFTTSNEAGEWLNQQHVTDSYLLIKGSRSMQMENVLDYF